MEGIFDKNSFILQTKSNELKAQELFVEGWKRSTVSLITLILLCNKHAQFFIEKSPVLRISRACESSAA